VLVAAAYPSTTSATRPTSPSPDSTPSTAPDTSAAKGQETLAQLVAHHSGARVEARLRRPDAFEDEFPFLDSPWTRR